MSQRNLFPGPQTPTSDDEQIWNYPLPDTHLPSDNTARSTAVLRPVGYPSTNFPNYAPRPPHDPYFHLPSVASSSHFPPDQYSCGPLPGSSMVHPQSENRTAAFKRKTPDIPLAYNGVNTNGCYSAGSSSNPLQHKPMMMHQYNPLDPDNISHCHGSGNHIIVRDEAQRNVRSRHFNPHIASSSSNMPHHFHTEGYLMHVPSTTTSMAPQGDHRFNYEGNLPVSRPNIVNNSIVNNSAFHSNISEHRNTSSLPTYHDPISRPAPNNSNGYNPRSNPYYASSSQTSAGFSTALLQSAGPPGMESSRHSRPLHITGRSSYRNGRPRSLNSQFHGGYVEDSTRSSRWSSEGSIMTDQSLFYYSRNLFDQHRDMRLDIDNMSYEELLALGERIGHVNTGLSDETISNCLEETTYCYSTRINDCQEEEKCVICLEEYKNQDKLASLTCRHDFHVSCIKNWLQIKNACPICKATAFGDASKGKQL